jgi:hypothetical protein
MFKKNLEVGKANPGRRNPLFSLFIILCVMFVFVSSDSLLGLDEECDTGISLDSVADRLCVPAIALEDDYVIDGNSSDWQAGNYYSFIEYAGPGNGDTTVLVSHKKREFDKADLYLFFEVASGDAVGTFNDEIRIGLNPGTTATDNTLIKIRPWDGFAIEVFTFNGSNWVSSSNAWMVGNVAFTEDALTESWRVEVKIPLEQAPAPITGTDFRLYLELIKDDGVMPVDFMWPPHYVGGLHNYICNNPTRWHPMSFGSECFPDLHIANGLYSCDAIYILKNNVKTKEIEVNHSNDFHADVTNSHATDNATDVQVYMTLLQLGISTAPLAMNYDHTDTNITNWFEQKWGTWLLATDHLDTGTPKPPASFTVNASSTETGSRFTWIPADETRFGTPAQMVGSHKCTAAFVDFKDDPNMENNLSYCNTSIVDSASGNMPMPFWMGPYFPHNNLPAGSYNQKLKVTALNEPYDGWFKGAKYTIRGEGVEVKQLGPGLFEAPVPEKGNNALILNITLPQADTGDDNYDNYDLKRKSTAKSAKSALVDSEQRLKEIYGNRPIVLIEGYAPAGYTTRAGRNKNQLYRITAYAAFAFNLKGRDEGFIPGKDKFLELTLPFAYWTMFEKKLGLDDGPVLGAKLGYWLTPRLTLELEGGVGFTKDVTGDSGNWCQLMGNIRYHLRPLRIHRWTPYVTAGAGYLLFRGLTIDDEAFALQGGVGLIYRLTPRFGLRFDGRVLRLGSLFRTSSTTNYQLGGGLMFWF